MLNPSLLLQTFAQPYQTMFIHMFLGFVFSNVSFPGAENCVPVDSSFTVVMSPVCHYNSRPIGADLGQRSLDVSLSLGVQGGRGLAKENIYKIHL